MRRTVLGLLFWAIAIFPPAAASETVTVTFTGSISAVGVLSPPFNAGDSVSGSFEFESDAPDQLPDPEDGSYDGPANFEFNFGSYTATAAGGPSDEQAFISVTTSSGIDEFAARAGEPSGPPIGPFVPTRLELSLEDLDGTALLTGALPGALVLSDFEQPIAAILFSDGESFEGVSATVTSIEFTVPEPGAPRLLAVGALLLSFVRRRRAPRGEERVTLDPNDRGVAACEYPSGRSFVVRVKSGVGPAPEALCGRAEHLFSGRAATFDSLPELARFFSEVLHEDEPARKR